MICINIQCHVKISKISLYDIDINELIIAPIKVAMDAILMNMTVEEATQRWQEDAVSSFHVGKGLRYWEK